MLLMLGAFKYVTLMLSNSNSVAIFAMSLFPLSLIYSIEGLSGWCGRCICRNFWVLFSGSLMVLLERKGFGYHVTIGRFKLWAFLDCFWKILVSEWLMCPLLIIFLKRKLIK